MLNDLHRKQIFQNDCAFHIHTSTFEHFERSLASKPDKKVQLKSDCKTNKIKE